MGFRARLARSADAGLPRDMIGFAAERVMALEAGSLAGAVYRECERQPREGIVELRNPSPCDGGDYSAVLEPQRIAERALPAVIQEACVEGIVARPADDVVCPKGTDSPSKKQVSRRSAHKLGGSAFSAIMEYGKSIQISMDSR